MAFFNALFQDFNRKSHFSQNLSIFIGSRYHFRKRLIKSNKKKRNSPCDYGLSSGAPQIKIGIYVNSFILFRCDQTQIERIPAIKRQENHFQSNLADKTLRNPPKKARPSQEVAKHNVEPVILDNCQMNMKKKKKKKLKVKKSKNKTAVCETSQIKIKRENNGCKTNAEFDFNETTKLISNGDRNKPFEVDEKQQKLSENLSNKILGCNIMDLVKKAKSETLEKSSLNLNAKLTTTTATTKPIHQVPNVRKFFNALESKIKTTIDKVSSNINKVKLFLFCTRKRPIMTYY